MFRPTQNAREHELASESLTPWGQQVSLQNSIKRVLGDYSDRLSVLLELLQNADDAGATRVQFFLDLRSFPSEADGLLGEGMARCQGPALVAVNNAKFTEEDFNALGNIGCGSKRNNPMKTGRFGVGFNTVYHVTDCPSLVSADRVLILDPSRRHIENLKEHDPPGVSIDFKTVQKLKARVPNQFAPYSLYEVDWEKAFEHTLIRLPLRMESDKSFSMSSTTWSPGDVRRLFHEFADILKTCMLFLKNVQSIELNEITSDADNGVCRLAAAEFKHSDDVEAYRKALHDYICRPPEQQRKQFLRTTRLTVTLWKGPEKANHTFLVTSCIKPTDELPDGIIVEEDRGKMVQWSAVAMEVDTKTWPRLSYDTHGRLSCGKLMCFLPLPVSTGLPCWIHGCFALSSDRRNLAVESFDGRPTWETLWNKRLLAIAAECLAVSLDKIVQREEKRRADTEPDVSAFYAHWPLANKVNTQIASMADVFFDCIVRQQRRIFWSQASKTWVDISTACFATNKALVEAPPQRIVDAVLIHDSLRLVVMDGALMDELPKATRRLAHQPPVLLSVRLVADILRRRAVAAVDNVVQLDFVLPAIADLPPDDRVTLLASLANYLTSDTEVDLRDVPLPMLDDDPNADIEKCVGILRPPTTVFVVRPEGDRHLRKLFPTAATVVDGAFWRAVSAHPSFKRDTWIGHGVVELSVKNLGACLSQLSPIMRPNELDTAREWSGVEGDLELAQWLADLWNFIFSDVTTLKMSEIGDLGRWPLIPAKCDGRHVLVPLNRAGMLVAGGADQTVQDLLSHVGIGTLDFGFPLANQIRTMCKIGEARGTTIADALRAANAGGCFDQMNANQRNALLQYLLGELDRVADDNDDDDDDDMADAVKELPLFEVVNEFGEWTFGPLTENPLVLPEGIPVTPACCGLFKSAHQALGMSRTTKDRFFAEIFFGLYDEVDVSRRLAERCLGIEAGTYDTTVHGTCPMAHIVPWHVEVAYWELIAADPNLVDARHAMRTRNVIPVSSPMPPLEHLPPGILPRRADGTVPTLTVHLAHFLMSGFPTDPGYSRLAPGAPLNVVKALARFTIDTKTRLKPSQCSQPATVMKERAPFPGVVSMLTRHHEQRRKDLVPDVLYQNVRIQRLLVDVGVNDRGSSEDVMAAASALQDLLASRLSANELRDVLVSWGVHHRTASNDPVTVEAFVRGRLHAIGVSLCLAAAEHGDEECCEAVAALPILIPAPHFVVHGCELHQIMEPAPPKQMVKRRDAALAFSQRPVADPRLDVLPDAMIPPPPTTSVYDHLVAFGRNGEESPQRILARTRGDPSNAIDATLADIYRHLARENYRCTDGDASVVAIPRAVEYAYRSTKPAVLSDRAAEGREWCTPEEKRTFDNIELHSASYRKLVPLSHVTRAPCSGSVAPFLFRLADFTGSPETLRFLRSQNIDDYPPPQMVVRGIRVVTQELRGLPAGTPSAEAFFATYCRLLAMLISSASHLGLDLAVLVANESASLAPAGTSLRQMPIFLSDGGVTELQHATVPDHAGLLQRCNRSKLKCVHPQLDRYTCKALGVPTMSGVLREELVEAEAPNDRPPPCVGHWNTMLLSPHFSVALERVLKTERIAGLHGAGSDRVRHGTVPENSFAEKIGALRCECALSITTTITDERYPGIDFAADHQNPAEITSAFESTSSVIHLVLRDPATPEGALDHACAPSRLAKEINRALGNVVADLSPLVSVIAAVGAGGQRAIANIPVMLDRLDCPP